VRKRTLVTVVIVIFIFVGKTSYRYAYNEGWNENQQINDRRIMQIMARHNLGKNWESALGSLKEAELLAQVSDGVIYVSAYTAYGSYFSVGVTASTKSDTIVLRGVFEETFIPTVDGTSGNQITWIDSLRYTGW